MNIALRRISLATLALPLTLNAACSNDDVDTAPVLRPVRTQQVFATGGGRVRMFSGVAKSGVESKLSFKVGGTIQRLHVRVGETVRKDQLIAELDPEDYRLQLQDTQASLSQSKAQERNAKLEYQRVQDLYESRNASKQDLDAARTTQESAKLAVESLEKRLELAQRQLDYTRLKAPIAGSIASRNFEVNENVLAGQTIVLLTSDDDIEIQVAVPGVIISQVREGDQVAIRFDALQGQTLEGSITEVGVASTSGATTFPVTVALTSSAPNIRSGMAAEVDFAFGSEGESTRFLVPTIAVQEDREGRFVYVATPSDEDGVGVIKRVVVITGGLTGSDMEVRQGLNDGDHVVIAGVSKITDGQRVKFLAGE